MDKHRQRREKKTAQARDAKTWCLLTQNVRGFNGRQSEWYNHFRGDTEYGKVDMVLLQETHVRRQEMDAATSNYDRHWGFRSTGVRRAFWVPADGSSGGVGLLINPYGAIRDASPSNEDLWTEHFMAVECTIAENHFLICNVYAPTGRADRERFFQSLAAVTVPPRPPSWWAATSTVR
jgi:exonuclease III